MTFWFFIILVIIAAALYVVFKDNMSFQVFRETIQNFGIWAPIVFIILYVLGTIFIPSTPFMAAAGILFGFKYGLLYTVIGGLVSSLVTFALSRKLGKDWVDNILKNKYLKILDKYNNRLENGGILDLIAWRIAPIMPFNALNILMGVSRIKTREYIIGTLLGLAPSNVLAVYFGTVIVKIF